MGKGSGLLSVIIGGVLFYIGITNFFSASSVVNNISTILGLILALVGLWMLFSRPKYPPPYR